MHMSYQDEKLTPKSQQVDNLVITVTAKTMLNI